MTLEELLDAAQARIRRYTPHEAAAAIEHGALLVDIRAQDARDRDGAIRGAYHVPRTVLEWRVASDEDRNPALEARRIVLVCDHGFSSILAAASLVDLGCDAGDVIGGFAAWVDAGLPVTDARSHDGRPGMGPPD
ncbi:MAG TPA: rhodanese-like domain-containing protein [Gaiellaceae bacterium]